MVIRRSVPVLFLAVAFLGSGLAAAPARADDRSVGIVTEIAGDTVPALAAYDELTDRANVKLSPATRLTFVHYATCRAVTVSGGTLYIDKTRYALTGGTVEHTDKTDCPTEQRLAANAPDASATGAAALIVRGTAQAPRLPGKPVIVLAGPGAAKVKSATVRRGDQDVGAMEVTSRTIAWSSSLAALPPAHDYALRLKDAAGASIAEFPFTVDAELVTTSPMILRLE